MKLRLLMFTDCNRVCRGCCNKDWNLELLPVCNDYSPFKTIMLTGGEPLLRPELVLETIAAIRASSSARVYVYTAKTNPTAPLLDILDKSDGLTVTLHTRKDVAPFLEFNQQVPQSFREKNLRLNVFRGISVPQEHLVGWKVKRDIAWIKDAPLPDGEVLMRL